MKKYIRRIVVVLIFVLLFLLATSDYSNAEGNFNNTIENGTYEIISIINNSKLWEISDQNISQVWDKEDSFMQIFEINYLENINAYTIKSVYHNKMVGVNEEGKIVLYELGNLDSKVQWDFSKNSLGYIIKSKYNGKVLDIAGGDINRGSSVRTFNYNGTKAQHFKLQSINVPTNAKTIDNGEYQISLASDASKVIEVTGANKENGGNIEIWTNNQTVNQKFIVTYLSDGYYKIEGKYSGKALDVQDGNNRRFANVQQFNFSANDNQEWIIKACGNGYYNIISKSSGLYVESAGGGTKNGTNIRLYSGNGTTAQRFKFTAVSNIAHSSVLEDGEYQITSALNSINAMSIANGSKNNIANCQLNTNKHSNYQLFEIKNIGDGYYEIMNKNSGKLLEAAGGGIFNWTNVSQYAKNDTEAQKWIIKDCGNGLYSFISKLNGLYMEAAGGSTSNGTNIQLYVGNNTNAQKFYIKENIKPAKTIDDGLYQIASALDNSLVMDIDGAKTTDNANVQIWKNNDVPQQKFEVKYLENGYYTIKASHSGKVLDLQDWNMNNFANVQQYTSTGLDAQQWLIRDAGNGYYNIISKLSEKSIEVAGGGTALGTNIRMYTDNGTTAQKFKFIKTKSLKQTAYKIETKSNRIRVLDVDNASNLDGTSVHIWDKEKHRQQIFSVQYVDDTYFMIKADYSNKVLSIDSNGNVCQTTYTGSNNQLWTAEIANDGSYFIKLKSNGKYLMVDSSNNGAEVDVSDLNSNDNRYMFYFNPISQGRIGTYGKSGLYYQNGGGFDLKYYEYGCGENTMFATFEVHGFEDNWDRDGEELRRIADDFYSKLVNSSDSYIAANWTVYIFPTVNPDGLYYGTSNNGPGRTTLYSKANGNKGMDLNRTWQVGNDYKVYTNDRNYNGTQGFQAYEAEALKNFMLNNKSTTGRNILVDLHGWEGSLIGSTELLANYYKPQFTDSVEKYERYGTQYVISWGRAVLGAESALVELPYYIRSHQDALNYNISGKYITATTNMLKNISLENKVNVSKKLMNTNQSTLINNLENNYYVAILGMEENEVPLDSKIVDIKSKFDNKKGVIITKNSEDAFLNIINKLGNYDYNVDEDGFLLLENDEFSTQNKYDKFLCELINSDKLYVFSISGKLYLIDPVSLKIVSNDYEELDNYQTYDYSEYNGNFAIDIPKNKDNKLTNEEIFDSIIKMIELESMR